MNRRFDACRLVEGNMKKSLGIALDDETDRLAPRAVLIEIMAAHYVRDGDPVNGPFLNVGWGVHMCDGKSEHFGDLEADAPIAVAAGWLAREMSTTNPDHGWPWDPSRPVAGQYEEWLVKARGVVCASCTTTNGCPEHRMFQCQVCQKIAPWLDGAANDGPGMCSNCWTAARADHRSLAKIDAIGGRVPYAEDQLPIPLDMTPPGHVELEVIGGDEPPHGVEFEVLTGDEPDATVAP